MAQLGARAQLFYDDGSELRVLTNNLSTFTDEHTYGLYSEVKLGGNIPRKIRNEMDERSIGLAAIIRGDVDVRRKGTGSMLIDYGDGNIEYFDTKESDSTWNVASGVLRADVNTTADAVVGLAEHDTADSTATVVADGRVLARVNTLGNAASLRVRMSTGAAREATLDITRTGMYLLKPVNTNNGNGLIAGRATNINFEALDSADATAMGADIDWYIEV